MYITMLVNLNITSLRLSQNASIGRRLASLSIARATAKIRLKTTTCNTAPSATDLAMFSGKMWRMVSSALSLPTEPVSAVDVTGNCTPTPALLRLMAASPRKIDGGDNFEKQDGAQPETAH